MVIKPPNWTTGGCLASRHFKTPDGWLGLRHDSNWWTVTGCDRKGWRDFKRFETEQEAEEYAIEVYHEQIQALSTSGSVRNPSKKDSGPPFCVYGKHDNSGPSRATYWLSIKRKPPKDMSSYSLATCEICKQKLCIELHKELKFKVKVWNSILLPREWKDSWMHLVIWEE